MNRFWIVFLPLAVSACITLNPNSPPNATFDRIDQELKAAANSAKKEKNEALNQAMMPPLLSATPTAPVKVEPRFDLAVSAAPAAQVFSALVAGTRYSMLVPQEVSGNLTLNLKSVTVREALEAIRELYGYEFTFKGNRIFIQPNTLQTRMFQINYLASHRQGRSDVRVTSSSPSANANSGPQVQNTNVPGTASATQPNNPALPGGQNSQPDSSRVQTTSDSDFWKELNTALSAIVGAVDGRAVIINPLSGVVLVKAWPGEMRAVENYLKATQLIVERQVMLEAKILEVQLSDGYQSGVNWAKFRGLDQAWTVGAANAGATLGTSDPLNVRTGGADGASATVTPGKYGALATTPLGKGFFGLAFQSRDFASMLTFLETQGDVQVLSSPRVAAINNQKAVLKVGTDDYFVTNISTTATTSGSNGAAIVTPSITLQPFFSGVALDVMPQIDEDGHIILHVHPSVSLVQEKSKAVDLGTLGTFTLPLASSSVSESDSVVRVQDGHIVAIGGLMSQSQSTDNSGLPFLQRVTGVGTLFGQKTTAFRKRELVILLKPTVIQGENAWQQDLMDTQIRIQNLDPRPKPPVLMQ